MFKVRRSTVHSPPPSHNISHDHLRQDQSLSGAECLTKIRRNNWSGMGYTDSPKRRGLPRSVAELDRSRLDSIIEDALFCKPFPFTLLKDLMHAVCVTASLLKLDKIWQARLGARGLSEADYFLSDRHLVFVTSDRSSDLLRETRR